MYKLVKFDEIDESMSVYGTLNICWQDLCARWNDSSSLDKVSNLDNIKQEISNLSHIAFPNYLFWKPTILHQNNYNDNSQVVVNNGGNLNVNVFPSGWLEWSPTGTWRTTCILELKKFPFDTQTCSFVFELWDTEAYSNITWAQTLTDLENPEGFTTPMMIWQFKAINSRIDRVCFPMGEPAQIFCSAEAHFQVTVKRKTEPYFFSIFIPSISLVILQVSPFAMSPHHPERATYSVTILLAFAVINELLQQQIPQTAEVIYLVVYISTNIVIGTLCTIYSVISVALCEIFITPDGKSRRIVLFPCYGRHDMGKKRVSISTIRFIDLILFNVACIALLISNVMFFIFAASS